MISFPLLKSNIRSNYVIFLIFVAILMIYLTIIGSMYDPGVIGALEAYLELLPQEMVRAMNFSILEPNLTGFLAGYFYGFLILLFPLIYTGIMANRAIASYVDTGSMGFLLSTPNPRWKIALTQAYFLIGSVKLLLVVTMVAGIIFSEALFPGELDIWRFVLLNIGAILLYFAISGIGFFASCLFNETRFSLALGAGVPVVFLLMKMLADVDEQLSGIGRASLISLFDPEAILALDSSVLPSFVALFVIGIVLYAAGIVVFSKKDLPL
ncbi:MAG TPA: ABC transporter permease subunit [Levilinea sp.]|nr:ABC transporter permease subunit [Levilinea sp.]